MQISGLNGFKNAALAVATIFAALTMPAAVSCFAESAYIAQVPSHVVVPMTLNLASPPQQTTRQISSARAAVSTPPEGVALGRGGNIAQTLQIGTRNSTYHLQAGGNNSSSANIIGNYNNVTVLQAGNNLKSNVVLLNSTGLNVGVIQPAGSAPVNVLIARLPGGGLLIKR